MPEPTVLTARYGDVALITLNRPQARNALNQQLNAEFVAAMAAHEDVAAIVLTGADPAFCAGVDLKELAARGGAGDAVERGLPTNMSVVRDMKMPVIGAINGPCMTGGLEIALNCDFLIGSERALFADTHGRVGVYPGGGMTVHLARRVGVAFAKEMSFTGNFVDAETALRVGLLNRVVPHAELVPTALKLAADIASCKPRMVLELKAGIGEAAFLPLPAAWEAERARATRMHHAIATGELGALAANAADVMSRSREQRG